MKNLDEVKVSVYTSVHATKNTPVTMVEVLAAIRTGRVKDTVLATRRYYAEGDTKAAQAMKARLPCFTASGLFRGGHAVRNLVEATGFVILDFDEVDDLETLRAACEGDAHTVGGFRSPLKGYKVIAHVENAEGRHREAYELVRAHYEEITGLSVDASGKDISRTCYFSYDPECYIAALFDSFVLCDAAENLGTDYTDYTNLVGVNNETTSGGNAKENPSNPCNPRLKTSQQESFAGREADFICANLLLHPLREGNRNQGTFILGCKAAKAGCDLEAVYANLAEFLCGDDFTKEELKRTLQSAYQKVEADKRGEVTHSSDKPETVNPSNRHYKCRENADKREDDYLAGEELRRHTPQFSEEVYGNIPTLLNECLEEDMLPRRRDVRLLASLTAYSALMPCTTGQYNHKRYSPHLYTWIIAPPAGGKGAAEAALHLLDVTHDVIERESDRLWKDYQRKLDAYKNDNRQNRKAKERVEQPDEPEQPPYRSLVIPSNTSLSRIITQLRDNGDLGGIIFDTEAETLGNSNKQDYGHLDTVLCKSYEHEPVSSSYFVHGRKPISCRRPHLAMMLTSTLTQVGDLLGYTDKGLTSRTLIHTYGYDYHFTPANDEGESTDEQFERLSHRAYELFRFCREHPLDFRFSASQWNELNRTFSRLNRDAYLEDRDDLMATVRRYSVCVMRVAMVLARLEQFEDANGAGRIVCSERAFRVALGIVLCCYEHCRLLFTSFNSSPSVVLKDPNARKFPLEQLPPRFTRAEAVKVGESCGLSERTVERLLKKLEGLEIRKIGHGCYEFANSKSI